MVFLFPVIAGAPAGALKKGSYRLLVERGEQKLVQKISVGQSKNLTRLEFQDDAGEKTVTMLTSDLAPVEVRYYNKSGQEYMRLAFDHDQKEAVSTGLVKKKYSLERDTFDSNGSIFLILAAKRPAPGKRYLFDLLQSKEERLVTMFFEHTGTETLKIGGKTIQADVYETGVESSVIALFWPYRYRYWYSRDGRFLQYEGPVGHENRALIRAQRPI